MSPLTVLILISGSVLRCSVTDPETELTLAEPVRLSPSTVPLTVCMSTSPSTSLTISDPETLLTFTTLCSPETTASPLTVATVTAASLGTEMLTVTRLRPKCSKVRLSISMMLLLSHSLPWSTRRVTPSQVTFTGSPSTWVISTRAVGESSCVTTSTRPPTIPTSSLPTRSFSSPMSRTRGPSMRHSCVMRLSLRTLSRRPAYTLYRVPKKTRYIAYADQRKP